MACPVPTAISNGYYVGAKVSYAAGDVIQYVCNTDYVMSGSPMSVCDATGNWVPASGSLPECSISYFSNIWFLLVVALIGFIALIIILILVVICCRVCCKKRVYDEESETERGSCCRPRCSCCTCCSADSDDEDDGKPLRPVRRKPLTTARKGPAKKSTAKKGTAKKAIGKKTAFKAGKDKNSKKKVVSKKGKLFSKSKGKKGGKTLKKGKGKTTGKAQNGEPRVNKKVWKPFANPVKSLDTSTSTKITKRVPL